MPPPLFHPNFGSVPLDEIAHVGVSLSIILTLISREIIFEVFQNVIAVAYLNVTDGRTDGVTDDIQTFVCIGLLPFYKYWTVLGISFSDN